MLHLIASTLTEDVPITWWLSLGMVMFAWARSGGAAA